MTSSTSGPDEHAAAPDEARSLAASDKRQPRLLIIVENLAVPFDRRVWSEATALAHNGYQVSVICPKGKNATASYEVIEGIHIFRHWMPLEASGMSGYLLEYFAALFFEFLLSIKVLWSRGFDVIQACNPPDTLFLIGAFYKYLFGKRFVFDHHDISPELFEAKFGRRGMFWKLLCLLERCTFAVADYSIATNESYRSIAIERDGMNPDRAFVVRTGPNLKRVRILPPDEKWKKGRKFLVAYVGVIAKQEGLDLLLESVTYLRDQRNRNDIQFVIVGSGPDQEEVVKLSHSLGLDDPVTFTGRVDDHTLFTILSTANVCVNPDRPNAMNDKSTMIKIMEYMAIGKPIVQFDLTEGRKSALDASLYARKNDTADFGDKICELLDDPEKAQRMGEFGRDRVMNVLSWEHEEKKLLKFYEAVFQGVLPAQ